MAWKSIALALALLGASCSRDDRAQQSPAESYGASGGMVANAPAPVAMADTDRAFAEEQTRAAPQPSPAPQPGAQADPGAPMPIMYLAYSYQTGLKLPGERLIGVMDAHIQACQQAGPRVCQLISSNRSGDPETYLTGMVQMRGEPVWLRGFRTGLERQASQAGGRIVTETTITEDLTRAIVDTEAQLRAKRALRDRLQQLLASRPGRLSDLLEAERELARVQGEIDAIESSLTVMRTRVAMSDLTLTYESSAEPLRADLLEPLGEAFANFAGWVVKGLAAIVTLIAVALPWALLGTLVLWLTRRWRAQRRGVFWRHSVSTQPQHGGEG